MTEFVLFGRPVRHSLSPHFQNAAFRALGISARYLAQSVDERGLREGAVRVAAGQLGGANITAPWKREAYLLCQALSPEARIVGAVNTWRRTRRGELRGENTDACGFRAALLECCGRRSFGEVTVLGAGGAAAAVALVAAECAERVSVVARDAARGEALCARILATQTARGAAARLHVVPWPRLPSDEAARELLAETDLIVHAAGAADDPAVRESLARLPWDALSPISAAMDLAYSVEPSAFLLHAAGAGASCFDGAPMLLHQGIAALELWLSRDAPADAMRAALAERLGRDPARLGIPRLPPQMNPAMPSARRRP